MKQRVTLAILGALITCLSPSNATAQYQYSGPDTIVPAYYLKRYGLQYEGVIGEKLVKIKLLPGKIAQIAGHYYSRDLREHLIAGEIIGPRDLHLVELDSLNNAIATLRLHFNEYDSLSTLRGFRLRGEVITGTYEQGPRVQPIRLVGYGFVPINESEEVKQDWARSEERVQQFVSAVLADDRTAVMSMIKYPLRINGFYKGKSHPSRQTIIKSKQELLKAYGNIFNDMLKRWLMTELPKDLSRLPTDRTRNTTGIMIAAGTAWFDVDGYLTTVNLPESEPPSRY